MNSYRLWDQSGTPLDHGKEPQSLLIKGIEQNAAGKGPIYLFTGSRDLAVENIFAELRKYSSAVLVDCDSFAGLPDPNNFKFRFLGVFSNDRPIFEFFDGEEDIMKSGKIELRSAFEESLFQLYFGNIERSYAGFYNIVNIFPEDQAANLYRDRCEEKLGR